jgi:hypothetical protein
MKRSMVGAMKLEVIIKDATPGEIARLVSFLNNVPMESPPTKSKTKITRVVVSKLKIPFPCGTKEYQRARRLCIAYGGVPYLDALRASGALQVNEAPVLRPNEPHWKDVIKKSANPTHEPRVTV